MDTNGIMQEIRELLTRGKSSGQVIALGYKAPTVYKVLRHLRMEGKLDGKRSPAALMQGRSTPLPVGLEASQQGDGTGSIAALRAENADLRNQIAILLQAADDADSLEAELEDAQDRLAQSEAEARELAVLRQRVTSLEPEAGAAGQLRQRVKELEGQLDHAGHTQAAIRQSAAEWQRKFEAETAACQEAERRSERLSGELSKVSQENQRLRGELDSMNQAAAQVYPVLKGLIDEVNELRPLKVWSGHPCGVCKKPMDGAVDREAAARVMKDFGHKECLHKQGSDLGWLLAGGVGLYALSRLR